MRPSNVFLGDRTPYWSTRVEDYVTRPNTIRLVFTKPNNNGFYVKTTVEYWERNTWNIIDNVTSHLVYYPTMVNNTAFYQEFTYNEKNWHNQGFYSYDTQTRQIWIPNLKDKQAYKFRVRQCDENNDQLCSEWSDWKVLTTSV